MPFDIRTRMDDALQKGNLNQRYSKNAPQIVKAPISSANLQPSKNARSTSPAAPPTPPRSTTPPAPAQSSTPYRPPVFSSPEIIKGQKWKVQRPDGSVPQKLSVGMGWKVTDSRCDIDASAFMLGANEKVPADEWFVFYGQETSPDSSVQYHSGKAALSGTDKAEILIDLSRVSPSVQKVTVCLTIYEALSRNLHFGSVQDLYAKIYDENRRELAHMQLRNLTSDVTSLVVGELYRYQNTWKFCAVASGYHRDLAEFCGIYGVALES